MKNTCKGGKWVINKAQPAAIIPGFLANDVYFVGSLDGTIKAYSADDGKDLWKIKNPAPILSWLWVENNSLYLGGGIPGTLGKWPNKSENGMFAYSLVNELILKTPALKVQGPLLVFFTNSFFLVSFSRCCSYHFILYELYA